MGLTDRLSPAAPMNAAPAAPAAHAGEGAPAAVATPPSKGNGVSGVKGNGGNVARGNGAKGVYKARDLQGLKNKIHRDLIGMMDLTKLEDFNREQLEGELKPLILGLLVEEPVPLTQAEAEQIANEIMDEIFGLGPLEPLLKDPKITEIMVNGAKNVYVERGGIAVLTDVEFADDAHLLRIIDRIVNRVGRRVDESTPMCDARLADGSRVNAIIAPLALDGPALSIRRFGTDPLKVDDLLRFGSLTPQMVAFLRACVEARLNILICGGTGSGKTTLLNTLSGYIPFHERIVTIEDAAELQLQQEHVVRLETRPPNIEGKGEVTQRDLVKNTLRMRPDRIVLGEVRSGEAMDMLQAMNTGHDGSMSTLHANNPREALGRLEVLVAMSGVDVPPKAVRGQIAAAIHLLVHASRLQDGSRKIAHITEVTGMEGDVITLQDIFLHKQTGVTTDGSGKSKVVGYHTATGIRPQTMGRIEESGIHLPPEIFNPHAQWME